jgi:transposase InsO family protein
LGWAARPAGLEPAERYERERPGELVHVDVKKLGRIHGGAGKRITGIKRNPGRYRTDAHVRERKIVGWDFVHVAIDDCTRLAYAEVLADEKASTAIGFLTRALAFYQRHGITVERVMTDNGSAYRSTIHALACRVLGVRHLRTRAYRPQTNGKAERLIRTMLAGWAYGAIYSSSRERTAALDGWLYRYNHHRPHRAIGRQPPISRLNNLLGTTATEPDRVAHELRDRDQGVLADLHRQGRKPLHERAPRGLRGGGRLLEIDRPRSGLVQCHDPRYPGMSSPRT